MIHADVAILGLGAMGTAAAWELARRGVSVVGCDAHAIPNTRASHHGGSRVIRLAYAEHPDYVPLLRRSFQRWQELERSLGETILHLVGGLYMGPPDGPFISGVRTAVTRHGLAHDLLDADAIRRRYPVFDPPPGTLGVLERQAGALMCERIVAGQARLAMAAGARLFGHAPVTAISRHPGRIELETAIGPVSADRVLVAGGAWTGRILGDLAERLVPTRQVVGWFQPRQPARFAPSAMPVWGFESTGSNGRLPGFAYGFPMLPDRPGVKVARHVLGDRVDPDAMPRTITDAERTAFAATVAEHLPDAAGPVLSMSACLYTNSPDGHFLLGPLPGDERVVVAAGFSGHGFKFASVMGEALADLCMHGRTDLPIGFLDPARFG